MDGGDILVDAMTEMTAGKTVKNTSYHSSLLETSEHIPSHLINRDTLCAGDFLSTLLSK